MPKLDPTRNYYADLEVSPTASVDEIKKQFRKLALKYHPDRNPGREAEVNSKFQIIQSAHEILTDETQRRKYDDTLRSSRSRYPGASGVRGNPWQDAAKAYPPPPRRAPATNNAQSRPASGAQSRPTSGAHRYSNFTGGSVPRGGKTASGKDGADARSNYQAWESMRGRPVPPPPTPGRAPTSATRESKASEPEPSIPRAASQKQKAQASFGNSARRAGYTPRSPGLGDEPPAPNKNYFTDRTHTNIFNEMSASAARKARNSSAQVPPDPLAQFRENYMDGHRSTPYHTPGGEKTSLHEEGSAGLGRAKSTRESSRKADGEGLGTDTFPFPTQRPRSSSTPRTSSNDGRSEDSGRASNAANIGSRRTANNGNTFPSRASDRYKPRPSTTDSTTEPFTAPPGQPTTEPSTASTGAGPSVYALPTTPYFIRSRHPYVSPFCSLGEQTTKTGNSGQSQAQARDIQAASDMRTSSGVVNPEMLQRRPFKKVLAKEKLNPTTLEGHAAALFGDTLFGTYDEFKTGADYLNSSFTFTSDPSTSAQSPGQAQFSANGSSENINTKFVDDQNEDGWEFKAGGPSAGSPTPSRKGSRSGSRIGRSPARPVPRPRHATNPMPATQESEEEVSKAGFSAGEWSEKIGPQHFVPQPTKSVPGSPTRRAPSRKNSKPVKMTMGTAGLVEDEESSSSDGWREIPPTPTGVDSPNAMDIDPPGEWRRYAKGTSQWGTRPEWRAGHVEGAAPPVPPRPTSTIEAANATGAGRGDMHSNSVPASANPFAAPVGGSEDSEEFLTTFADFKKCEPFAEPAPTGLKSFADLKSTLPFDSKPSETIPLERDQPVGVSLDFPTPPVAPRLPPTMAVPSIRPNVATFRKYAQDFGNYMDKWEVFNQKVLDHFVARQEQYKLRRQQLGLAWLDSAQGGDIARIYQNEVEQDHEVRKKWSQWCDEHQSRMREYVAFRDRVK
ncbi:DnaJ domain-containing protein [Apiospora aurea]|uniref:DnaJ domain-containing protein n=1 Tax=Apiospora aurea TaxID=335848 RepID=A0ABR1QHF8_9PEZI